MKITIITPCRNAENLLGETMESVLSQKAVLSGRVELEYLIIDGASTDGTARIVTAHASPFVQVVSEADSGMYDALAKGLARATGDVVAYLNAGDVYHPRALDVVVDLFETKEVSWVTGYTIHYSERGEITYAMLPYRYRRSLFRCGLYGPILPYVQQESTFWLRSLQDGLDLEKLASLRFAGDFYLWKHFSEKTDLTIAAAFLGGFRRHRGQLSEGLVHYLAEMRELASPPTSLNRGVAAVDKIVWYFTPPTIKKWLNPGGLFVFDHDGQSWV